MSGSRVRFVVIGDATLDVTVRGAIPMAGADQPADIRLGPGGQGANLAVRLARRGQAVRLITAIGSDPVGTELRAMLAGEDLELRSLEAARTGIVVSLLDAGGERAMLSDRVSLPAGAWSDPDVASSLTDASWIHVSGYPLADPASGEALALAVGARREDQRASVGGGSFTRGTAIREALRILRPDLVLFDRREASVVAGVSAGGPRDPLASELAANVAIALHAAVVVTDGPAGVGAAINGETVEVAHASRPLVDATGAGDALAAVVLTTLAEHRWPPTAADLRRALELGAPAGAEVAGLVGAQARIPSEGSP